MAAAAGTPKAWSTRSTRSASASASRAAQTRRVFDAARALRLPVKLHAEQLSDQGGAALAAQFGALSCDHLEHLSDAGVQAMARGRHGRGAAARRVLLPARDAGCRRSRRCARPACRWRSPPTTTRARRPTLSLLLMLNMACTLFRLTPEEALRGVTAQRARARSACSRPRHARGRPARRLRGVGRRASERAGLLVRPQPVPPRRASPAWSADAMDTADVFTLHRGTRAAAGQRAARRHARFRAELQRALRRSARSRSKTPTGTSTGCTPSRARSARALLVPRYSRYVIDLNRPPENAPMYPGANNTELCPTRFFTGEPLYREGLRARRRRDRSAAREPTGSRTTTRLRAELDAHPGRARPRGAVRRRTASSRELPWLFEGRAARPEPRHRRRRELRAGAARRARPRARRAGALHACRRRPLQGRLHHAPLRPARRTACTRCSSRCAGAATWPRQPPLRARRERTRALCAGAARAACRRCIDWSAAMRMSAAPRAVGAARLDARRAGTTHVLLRVDADGRWAEVTPGVHARRAGRRPCCPARCCRAWSNAHSHAFQRAFAGLAERRDGGAATTSGRGATACTAWRCASRPSSCARSPRTCTSSCCAAATRRSASSTTCSTTRRQALRRPARDVAGRWPTRRATPASA